MSLVALASALALTLACSGPGDSHAGWQRVIVELRIDGLPPVTEGEARTAAIVSARDKLLAEIASAPHEVTRTFQTLPFVALAAPEATLDQLRRSPLVKAVTNDELNRTQ